MSPVKWSVFVPALVMFSMIGTASAQSSSAAPSAPQLPAPHLEYVFEEYVTLAAAIHPGTTPYGDRNIIPITGGVFSGPNIHGKILPGGWDWQLTTKGGCHSIKADYMIQTDDGAVINVLNKGTQCDSAGPNAKFYTAPSFEAPMGPYAWLNSGAFIGTLDVVTYEGKLAVHIRFYQVK